MSGDIWLINGRCEQCANQDLTGRHDPDCDCWCHDPDPDDYDGPLEGDDDPYVNDVIGDQT